MGNVQLRQPRAEEQNNVLDGDCDVPTNINGEGEGEGEDWLERFDNIHKMKMDIDNHIVST